MTSLDDLCLGDLVRVEWSDASKGEVRVSKDKQSDVQFDIPVTSWGVFLGGRSQNEACNVATGQLQKS